ncbi:hypothetical protein JYU34_020812 [Plutella xylostella]|uniref:Uncharacterized protein n=1 Tax=Plutella xylostella TaxID=51655 RepID=A0ABQ7PS03_PLUXY|nr:hypothetical protein JYU34_020812 [Plutella xylostella]
MLECGSCRNGRNPARYSNSRSKTSLTLAAHSSTGSAREVSCTTSSTSCCVARDRTDTSLCIQPGWSCARRRRRIRRCSDRRIERWSTTWYLRSQPGPPQ